MINRKKVLHKKRKKRIKKKIKGTDIRPRLSVFRSAKHIYVQAINDLNGFVLASASTLDRHFTNKTIKLNKSESAKIVGCLIGKRLRKKGIKFGVFDRNGFSYEGRVALIASSIRKSGLLF